MSTENYQSAVEAAKQRKLAYIAVRVANGWNQRQISDDLGHKSNSAVNEFMGKFGPELCATYDDTPAAERAKQWLKERNIEMEVIEPPAIVTRKRIRSRRTRYKKSPAVRAVQQQNPKCRYFIAQAMQECGSKKRRDPGTGKLQAYCPDHMAKTVPYRIEGLLA